MNDKKKIIICAVVVFIGVSFYLFFAHKSSVTASEGIDFDIECTGKEAYIKGLYNDNSYTIVDIPSQITVPTMIGTNDYKIIGIKKEAFCGFNKIEEVRIPQSIAVIEDNAFAQCNNIKKVIYKGRKYEWDQIQIGVGNEILHNIEVEFEE